MLKWNEKKDFVQTDEQLPKTDPAGFLRQLVFVSIDHVTAIDADWYHSIYTY